MFGKRKLKKLAKQKQLELEATELAKAQANAKTDEQVRLTQNYKALREIATWRNDLRENLTWVILGSLVLFIGILVGGYSIVIPIALVGAFLTNQTVKRFHQPPLQWVLYIKMQPNTATILRWIGIPYRLFAFIDREGLTNTIETNNYGPIYLVRDMVLGPSGIPISITFDWIHFPQYNFLRKKRVYEAFIEYLNKLVIADFELADTMESQSILLAREMTDKRMRTVNNAKIQSPLTVGKLNEDQKKKVLDLLENLDMTEERGVDQDEVEGVVDAA